MKKQDILFGIVLLSLFIPFFISETMYNTFVWANKEHGLIMSFIKFAILATMGEMIGLRIKTGNYNQPGFGLLPRAIVWGILGLTIKLAFVIFTSGTISFIKYMGIENVAEIFKSDFTVMKIFIAFSISATMNLIYAPVMMTIHKITDTHIVNNGGTVSALIKPFKTSSILTNINWNVQWNFVFKKTIPMFWIPAHTITFLLPEEFQILFAALLGIALGIILAIASLKSK